MVTIEIEQEHLKIQMQGADKLWALKSELSIPLEHILSARVDREIVKHWFHGFKLPGSFIPGVLTAGTFYQHGKRVFWDIHHPERAVIITLHNESYNELVVEVADPGRTVQKINEAIL